MSGSNKQTITKEKPEINSQLLHPAESPTNYQQPAWEAEGDLGKTITTPVQLDNGQIYDDQAIVWFSKIYNLLHNFDELAVLLDDQLQGQSWLNAFLVAAGLNQIAEDFLHPDPLHLRKAIKYAARLPYLLGMPLNLLIRTISVGIVFFNQHSKHTYEVMEWQDQIAELVDQLAQVIMGDQLPDQSVCQQLIAKGEALLDSAKCLPSSIRSETVRLPSCFRSFDQRPADLDKIATKFSERWPDRQKSILVVGVRTSGNYLAPLYAALLKKYGYKRVNAITIRPRRGLLQREKNLLKRTAQDNGLALICDDPPITGGSIAKVAQQIMESGFETERIILLLQLFGTVDEIPVVLSEYAGVLMPWSDWNIHQSLSAAAVEQVVNGFIGLQFRVTKTERLISNDIGNIRQHASALYCIDIEDPINHHLDQRLLLVKGVGLGYFGEHALAVAQRLSEFSPHIFALRDGLIYEEIPDPNLHINPSSLSQNEAILSKLVQYVIERNKQMAIKEDISLHMTEQNAVWEVSSNWLSQIFGRYWMLARIPLIDPVIRMVLRPARASVVDGDMAFHNWYYRQDQVKPLIKLQMGERDFSHEDLYSFDPVYDLACLVSEINRHYESGNALNLAADQSVLSGRLRQTYEASSSDQVSAEKWMLYQLVHIWDLNRQKLISDVQMPRYMARIFQRYYEEVYFKDLPILSSGPLCAIDIDGVLETNRMGFPSLTPSAALSLRALSLHGYRVLLASGRSLDEIKERCAAYHLVGGIGEYGSILYDHLQEKTLSLFTDEERWILDEFRKTISNTKGVTIDPDYRYTVRTYRLDDQGKREGLDERWVSTMLDITGLGGQIYPVHGKAQTDFMVDRIDKGFGIQAWLDWTQSEKMYSSGTNSEPENITLAVGDSYADLSMLTLAASSFAPANADARVKRSGIQIMQEPYQRGLEQAVARLLKHKPGECPVCHWDIPSKQTQFMQQILEMQELGKWGMPWQAVKLFIRERV